MLAKQLNKIYAGQIAGLFCGEVGLTGLCENNVKSRIVKNFTDELFEEYFLLHLDAARYYALTIAHAPSSEGFIRYIIGGFDIVSGKNKTMMIDGIPGGKRNDIAWVFNVHLNRYYDSINSPLHATYLGVAGGKHILQIATPNNYGIIFIPGSVGGGNGGGTGTGGGGGSTGGGGGIFKKPPIVIPELQPIIPDPGGIDLKKLLIPALVLAGAYLLMS